jgi:hypothetical protein
MTGIRRRGLAVLVGAIVVASLVVPLAGAAETSHDEYVTRVEPICKANTEANRQIFTGAKGEVQTGELEKAAKRFKRARVALGKTISQLQGVAQPVEDKIKLTKWLSYLRTEEGFIAKIGKALAEGDKYKAQTYSVHLNRNSNFANNTVLGFGFTYCRIDPSRFV